ncbi:MFS general substrate transporter [Xylariaceae sp. FL0804]|nr:MFS general substrate transporter [Xylariaceae sp. FL0804]
MSAAETVTAIATAEAQSYPMAELPLPPAAAAGDRDASSIVRGGSIKGPPAPVSGDEDDAVGREPAATPALKLAVAGYSFFCAGVNDGTLGPLIPYFLSSFGIGTGEIAIIYGTTFVGWLLAAVTNPVLAAHLTLGQLLGIGAALQLVAQCLRPWSPLPLFCITFFLQSLGMAYQDSHSNTFVSGLRNVPHRWLGFIHACYALGCFIGPLVATAIANSASSGLLVIESWRCVYFVLIGIGVLNMGGVMVAFRDTLYGRLGTMRGQERTQAVLRAITRLLRSGTLWQLSLFYFFFLGATFTAGGWVVEFLTTVRGGALATVGYVPTGFYGGMLAGRMLLAEPTFRLGERRMVLVYSGLCVALQLVFWLQPNIIGSAVALSFIGFFSGPFFATGMSIASKLFPRESQPAALGRYR